MFLYSAALFADKIAGGGKKAQTEETTFILKSDGNDFQFGP